MKNPITTARIAAISISVLCALAGESTSQAQESAAEPLSANSAPSDLATRPAQGSTDAYIQSLVESLSSKAAKPVSISLRDAVSSAISNNPGTMANRRVPEAEQHGVIEAASVFEPVIAIDANYRNSEEPTANALSGVTEVDDEGNPIPQDPADQIRKDDRYEADFSISKMFRTGTRVGLSWENARTTSNSRFEELSPSFEPSVGIRMRQPLLRDIGGVVANTNVRIASATSQRAAAEFEEQLSDFVFDVVSTYWDYVLAEAELEVRRHSHRLAQELADEAQKRVDIGSLPPVAAQEAQANAASREEEVIAAEQTLSLAARKLQYMIMFGAENDGIPRAVRPSDDHGVVDREINRSESLKTAVERRALVRVAGVDLNTAKLEEHRARTGLLPTLDLVGSYEFVGLGGVNENNVPDEYDALGDSFDILTSGDFFRYSVGLELEVPLSNAAARAQHTQSSIETKRQEDTLRQTIADVALEVDAGAGDLAAAFKRVSAANLSRELAQENLRQQERRYEVGKVTTTDVLDFQEDLADAMATEARAITDHAKATADLRRAEGTLLEHFHITVSFDNAPKIPWWAKF